jgi:CBS domain-containing protein
MKSMEGAAMTVARDIMTKDCECIGERETLHEAAKKMRDLDVGALPICGENDRLQGMLTDRDIVVHCVADGLNPTEVPARALAKGTPVYVEAQAPIEDVLKCMADYQIRRVPVIDDKRLVGIISQADVAMAMSNAQAGAVVEDISQDR